MHTRLIVISALLLQVCASVQSAPADPDPVKHWQKVMHDGRKVGHVEHMRHATDGRVLHTEQLTLDFGTSTVRQTYVARLHIESAADGSLLRVVRESKAPEGHTLIDARRTGDEELTVDIGSGDARHSRVINGTGPLAGEEFAREWLQAVGSGQKREPLVYRTFDAARLAIADVRLTRVDVPGPPFQARREVSVTGSASGVLLTLDSDGNVIDESLRLGGTTLRLVGATEAEARARGERLNHVAAQMQRSPYRIPARDMRAKIRYGFAHGGRPPRLPEGAGQRSWSDEQTTWIQVCASCPPDAATLSDAERASALVPTPWLNFGDPALTRRARKMAGDSLSAARRMLRLTGFVRGHIAAKRIDMLGYGSALEAFRNRRGDCTEYAVLLAAMGRAAGVPTRVVSGLVYARQFEGQRHVFVPHVWVQAWTGTGWESFDAGLGHFDSTHLAFAVSDDGNPATLFAGIHLAHELELRAAARVIPRAVAAQD